MQTLQTRFKRRATEEPTITCLYRYSHSIQPAREDCRICVLGEVAMQECSDFKKVEIYGKRANQNI